MRLLNFITSSNKGVCGSQLVLTCWYITFCCCVASFRFTSISCFSMSS